MELETEMIEWATLIEGLKHTPGREVAKIRNELQWMKDLVESGKMKTTEEFLIEQRETFRHRLLKLGVLI